MKKERFSPFKHLTKAFRALPRKRQGIITAGVALVLLMAFMTGNVYGRYVMDAKKTGVITAKKFYFTSNFLNGTHYQLTSDAVSIDLSNCETGKVSQVDVTFKVEVEDITPDVPDVPATVEMPGSNVLAHSTEEVKYITLKDMEENHTYQVTVLGYHAIDSSTSGYQKELSATITIKASDDNVYKWVEQVVVDGVPDPEHWKLIVWRQNGTGTATIDVVDKATYEANHGMEAGTSSFDKNHIEFMIPDSVPGLTITNTPPHIVDTVNFMLTPTSHEYFIGNAHMHPLTADDFIVTVGDKTATTKNPHT